MIPPSVCGYIFHNSQNDIISSCFSMDKQKLFTGSEESFIDVWGLSDKPLSVLMPSTELAAIHFTEEDFSQNIYKSVQGNTAKLVGHSGPVYKIANHSNNFIYSCSQDASGMNFFHLSDPVEY